MRPWYLQWCGRPRGYEDVVRSSLEGAGGGRNGHLIWDW